MAEGVVLLGPSGGEPVAHRTRGALEEIPRPATFTLRQTGGCLLRFDVY